MPSYGIAISMAAAEIRDSYIKNELIPYFRKGQHNIAGELEDIFLGSRKRRVRPSGLRGLFYSYDPYKEFDRLPRDYKDAVIEKMKSDIREMQVGTHAGTLTGNRSDIRYGSLCKLLKDMWGRDYSLKDLSPKTNR